MGNWTDEDLYWMAEALAYGREGLGRTAYNPSVGCVLVRDGVELSRGRTQDGGRPHAEAHALAQLAEGGAKGATAYVTLEPCAHASARGPDCSSTLVEAGIARLVAAMLDPDPRTAGDGFERLRAADVDVAIGCRQQEAEQDHIGFIRRITTGRPVVLVSDDGFGCDAPFQLGFRESFEDALSRAATEGLNRLWVRQGSPLMLALKARGLLG